MKYRMSKHFHEVSDCTRKHLENCRYLYSQTFHSNSGKEARAIISACRASWDVFSFCESVCN